MYKVYLSLSFFFLILNQSFAQKKNKKSIEKVIEVVGDRTINDKGVSSLNQHIKILSSDSFEGRRTGTMGEQKAISYIKNVFVDYGIEPKGVNNSYLQSFEINEGVQYFKNSFFIINDIFLQPEKDFFPLNMSDSGEIIEVVSPILHEKKSAWFLDLKDELQKNSKNPHYDIVPYIENKAKEFSKNGVTAIILYNSSKINDHLSFDKKTIVATSSIPIVYLNKEVSKKYLNNQNNVLDITIKIAYTPLKRVGTNVISYINNHAENTIVLGAHFDHLGYGEDKNSLYTGTPKMIHNGADDNASGVAALLELSRILKSNLYKKSNYLFIAFSGEELGLYGSKYFTDNPTIDLTHVNYMINMDMIGRLNDSTKAFTIGGFGTSPFWSKIINTTRNLDSTIIKIDSSGTGPSDHTSFYRKNIPVLFYFTGTHSDYHKPTDDYEKINFKGETKVINSILNVILKTNEVDKLVFTKTAENSSTSSSKRFNVSLGIMPDYTFSGVGVRADGISEGKLAQKIGLQIGDILIKLDDSKITSLDSYMAILSKFKKGDKAHLIILRNGKELNYNIIF